ncbi:hypothetical protein BCEN4_590031 [Burkholderia cenocepacia]|nr:hypothetical protein BCEN4_590031 [Burkholderia cenocepacia]
MTDEACKRTNVGARVLDLRAICYL